MGEYLVVRNSRNPIVNQLHAMKQRMDVLYSRSFEDAQEEADHSEAGAQSGSFKPPVDIWESGNELLIVLDLPGVADKDLQVEFIENRLTIRGNRRTSSPQKEMKAVQIERQDGTFSRFFILPDNTREESIKAEFKHGVLIVAIPKDPGPQATTQKVPVRAG